MPPLVCYSNYMRTPLGSMTRSRRERRLLLPPSDIPYDSPPSVFTLPTLRYDLSPGSILAFIRYSFTSRLLCINHPCFHSPRPPAFPTLMQYYCTIIGQYTTPLPTSRLLLHTIQYWQWQYHVKVKFSSAQVTHTPKTQPPKKHRRTHTHTHTQDTRHTRSTTSDMLSRRCYERWRDDGAYYVTRPGG